MMYCPLLPCLVQPDKSVNSPILFHSLEVRARGQTTQRQGETGREGSGSGWRSAKGGGKWMNGRWDEERKRRQSMRGSP